MVFEPLDLQQLSNGNCHAENSDYKESLLLEVPK